MLPYLLPSANAARMFTVAFVYVSVCNDLTFLSPDLKKFIFSYPRASSEL